MELVHGGDWAGYRAEFGRDALDFSANVSPLGLPAGVAAGYHCGATPGGPLPGSALPGPAGTQRSFCAATVRRI